LQLEPLSFSQGVHHTVFITAHSQLSRERPDPEQAALPSSPPQQSQQCRMPSSLTPRLATARDSHGTGSEAPHYRLDRAGPNQAARDGHTRAGSRSTVRERVRDPSGKQRRAPALLPRCRADSDSDSESGTPMRAGE
jgi:hypothetical protein